MARTSARWLWIVSCATIGVYMCVALAAGGYLRNREDWTVRQGSVQRATDGGYKRIVISGNSIDQNAAVWYRRSFALLRSQRPGTSSIVAAAVARNVNDSQIVNIADTYCSEARSQRIRQALLCIRCNWEINSSTIGDSSITDSAWTLGNCLVLLARAQAAHGDPVAAALAYVDALAFASDLSQADYANSLISMAIARSALEGLTLLFDRAVGDPQTKRLFDFASDTLPAFEGSLPNINHGLRFAALTVARRIDATRSRPLWLTTFSPHRIAAAWRFGRVQVLLTALLELSATEHYPDRERVAKQADEIMRATTESSMTDDIPKNYLSMVLSEEYLRDIFDAARAIVEIQKYRAIQGIFPERLPPGVVRPNQSHLVYRTLNDGYGCTLVIERDQDSKTVFERQLSPVP